MSGGGGGAQGEEGGSTLGSGHPPRPPFSLGQRVFFSTHTIVISFLLGQCVFISGKAVTVHTGLQPICSFGRNVTVLPEMVWSCWAPAVDSQHPLHPFPHGSVPSLHSAILKCGRFVLCKDKVAVLSTGSTTPGTRAPSWDTLCHRGRLLTASAQLTQDALNWPHRGKRRRASINLKTRREHDNSVNSKVSQVPKCPAHL